MRITKGNTRFVILTDRYAIKIARFRVLRILWGVVELCWKKDAIDKVIKEHELGEGVCIENFFPLLMWFLFIGLNANRYEYRLFQEHNDLPIAPVRHYLLNGLVIVQIRGEDVPASESLQFRELFGNKTGRAAKDFVRPEHVCRFGDRLCFIDYGHPDSARCLLEA